MKSREGWYIWKNPRNVITRSRVQNIFSADTVSNMTKLIHILPRYASRLPKVAARILWYIFDGPYQRKLATDRQSKSQLTTRDRKLCSRDFRGPAETMFSFEFPTFFKTPLLKNHTFRIYRIIICFYFTILLITIIFQIVLEKATLCKKQYGKNQKILKLMCQINKIKIEKHLCK